MQDKTLDQYFLQDIQKYEMLPEEEFIERREKERKNPDEEEVKRLVLPHMKLCRKIAWETYNKYRPDTITGDDLVSEAYFGLRKAYDRFNPEIGIKFISYASLLIKQSIRDAILDKGENIRLPRSQISKIRKVKYYEEIFFAENGRDPDKDELSKITEYKPEDIEDIKYKDRIHRTDSTSVKKYEDSDETIEDTLEDKKNNNYDFIEYDSFDSIIESTHELSDREKRVIKNRYLEDITLQELTLRLGVSKQRVAQIEITALKKIEYNVKNRGMERYGN